MITERILKMDNNLITLISGARTITRSISDKNILDEFLKNFSPTFDKLMRTKKYLYIECEGFKWIHIYDNDEQLREMLAVQDSGDEKNNADIKETHKEISYDDFLKIAGDEQMNFDKYSVLDGNLIFDF